MGRVGMVGALLVLGGCGAEIELGEAIGMSPIKGETKVSLSSNKSCETRACRVTFNRAVVMGTKKELAQIDDAVKAIKLEVRELSFTDVDRDVPLGADRMPSGAITVGQDVTLGVEQLAYTPLTLRIVGRDLDDIKAQVAAGDGATLMIHAEIVFSPPLPELLMIRYDVRPSLILGIR